MSTISPLQASLFASVLVLALLLCGLWNQKNGWRPAPRQGWITQILLSWLRWKAVAFQVEKADGSSSIGNRGWRILTLPAAFRRSI